MGNKDIFPFIGKVLSEEKFQVGYLHLRIPLSFYYMYLPKVLENTVDFWILMWNFILRWNCVTWWDLIGQEAWFSCMLLRYNYKIWAQTTEIQTFFSAENLHKVLYRGGVLLGYQTPSLYTLNYSRSFPDVLCLVCISNIITVNSEVTELPCINTQSKRKPLPWGAQLKQMRQMEMWNDSPRITAETGGQSQKKVFEFQAEPGN